MKKLLFILFSVSVLTACSSEPDKSIQCGAYEVSITFNGEAAETMDAVINGDQIKLQHVVSGSGARYDGVLNDTDVILWGKGQNWTLILNDGDSIECK